MAATDAEESPHISEHEDLRDDDNEVPEFGHDETVFSYLMFSSLWRQGSKSERNDVYMAYFLALLCLFIQGVLLAAIWMRVVATNVKWRNSVMNTGKHWDLVATRDNCNAGTSLCFIDDGTFTCAPPTVQLTGRWDELDLNKDGIWSFEEAEQMQEKIKCDLNVDSKEVFRVFVRFLLNRAHIIWLHPDVVAGNKIHKHYFDYAKGDIIMCGYRNADMCANLMERKFFDAPLKYNTVPRVGNTTASALNYCYDLLTNNGFCERTLPSTYSVWKIESVSECRSPDYSPFTYSHPVSAEKRSMLTVDYSARQDYEESKTPFFILYKYLLIFMWLLAMVYETKNIVLILNWAFVYPRSNDEGTDAVEEYEDHGELKYKITKVMTGQRAMIVSLTVLRLIMLMVLSVVGTTLLLRSTSYMTLIMDGVALVFVLDIASILYAQAVRKKSQEEINDHVDPMEVAVIAPGFLKRHPALQDALWLLFTFILVGVIMTVYYLATVNKLYDALQCTCLSQGKNCREAQTFDEKFWTTYWKDTTPGIFAAVDKLKAETPGAGAPAPALASAPGAAFYIEPNDFHSAYRSPTIHHEHHKHQHHKHHAVNLLHRHEKHGMRHLTTPLTASV